MFKNIFTTGVTTFGDPIEPKSMAATKYIHLHFYVLFRSMGKERKKSSPAVFKCSEPGCKMEFVRALHFEQERRRNAKNWLE